MRPFRELAVRSQDEKIRLMLGAFGRALAEAINGATEIGGAAREIRREGYCLHLVLGCLPDPLGRGVVEDDRRLPAKRPAFCLDSEDVAFLKSIGIDPTRSVRRRRKGGPSA